LRAQRAVQAADDAGRQRALQAERVADGKHTHADDQLGGVAPGDGDELVGRGVNLDDGQVVVRVVADEPGRVRAAVEEVDDHLPGVLDDVVVGEDVPFLVEHAARAAALAGQAEQELVRRHGAGGDVDDAAVDLPVDADVVLLFRGQVGRLRRGLCRGRL